MGLKKVMEENTGVTTEYHRILSLNIMPGIHNHIAVLSYINYDARILELNDEGVIPYRRIAAYNLPYDENMNIKSAYAYLKTLPDFQGATDVFEEGQVN